MISTGEWTSRPEFFASHADGRAGSKGDNLLAQVELLLIQLALLQGGYTGLFEIDSR